MRDTKPELEMTIEGDFVEPPKPPLVTRILISAILIAIIAGAASLAAFILGLALFILPIAVGAGVIAWLAFRYQLWRARRSVSGQRDVWRP